MTLVDGRFPPVPPLGAGPDLVDDVRRWVTSDALRALVEGFDGCTDDVLGRAGTDLRAALADLDSFTDRWDTRQGRERNESSELDLGSSQERLVLDATRALGLHAVDPPRLGHYDHVLVLGGLIRACLSRPAYAARLLATGDVRAEHVTALGGHRPFRGDEFDIAARVGVEEVDEEFEALDAGMRRAFGLSAPDVSDGERSASVGGTWAVRRYRTAAADVAVAAAPSTEPETRRANTADTYAWFARVLHPLAEGARLLLVTSPIYVPAQHVAALRMLALPHAVSVETVGCDPARAEPGLEQHFSASHYLMEIRSTVRALRALVEEVARRDDPRATTGATGR